MQAIRTRYHGATNTRGSRITATCEAGSLTMSFDHSLNDEGNHAKAAQLMLQRMGWPGVYHGGQFDGDHYWVAPSAWSPVASIDSEQVAA